MPSETNIGQAKLYLSTTLQKNLYEILEVRRYASLAEIKTSFKRLALRYHPDRNPGNAAAEEKFKEIANAYHLLSDKEDKHRYDLSLSGAFSYQQRPVTDAAAEEEKRKKKEQWIRQWYKIKAQREQQAIEARYLQFTETPLWLHRAFAIAVICFGIMLGLTNWLYQGFRTAPRMLPGFIVIIAGNILLQRVTYIVWQYQHIRQPLSFNISARVARRFFTGLFITYVLAQALVVIKPEVLYRNYPHQVTGFIFRSSPDEYGNKSLLLGFTSKEGQVYTVTLNPEEAAKYKAGTPVVIRYSDDTPKKIVILGEDI